MKSSRLFAQTMHTLASLIGNQGLQIAAGIAVSRVYGPPGKGLVTYAGIAILGVVAIADGLGAAIARQCGTDSASGPAACAAALRIILMLCALIVIPLGLLGYFVPAQRALLYVAAALPFALYVQTMSGFHLLSMRVERTNLASLVINAGAASAMLVVTLTARPAIDVIMAIWAAGYVAGAAIIYQGLAQIRVDAEAIRASFARQFRFAIRSSSASLMTFFASRIDVFIVAAMLSATALGTYTLALACGELMWQIGRALSWSAYGRVATAPFSVAAELTAKITRIVLALELVTGIIAFIAGPTVIAFVYGSAFFATGLVLRLLIPGMALYAADSILTYFISVKIGRPGVILRVEAATLAFCTIGSLATIGRFGMLGPAVATSLAYLVSFTVKLLLFCHATRMSIRSLVLLNISDLRRAKSSVEKVGTAVA